MPTFRRAHRRVWLLLGAAGATLACGGLFDRVNLAPLEAYAPVLAALGGPDIGVERCRMYPASRRGRCTVTGPADQIAGLAVAIRGAPIAGGVVFDRHHCLDDKRFGKAAGDNWEKLQGVEAWEAGPNLPGNTDNVAVDSIWVSPSGDTACIELFYPFG